MFPDTVSPVATAPPAFSFGRQCDESAMADLWDEYQELWRSTMGHTPEEAMLILEDEETFLRLDRRRRAIPAHLTDGNGLEFDAEIAIQPDGFDIQLGEHDRVVVMCADGQVAVEIYEGRDRPEKVHVYG